jgi:hypothetical protein
MYMEAAVFDPHSVFEQLRVEQVDSRANGDVPCKARTDASST